MAVAAKVALADLLPAVVGGLVDPGLRCVGELAAAADPVEVFAFVGTLGGICQWCLLACLPFWGGRWGAGIRGGNSFDARGGVGEGKEM